MRPLAPRIAVTDQGVHGSHAQASKAQGGIRDRPWCHRKAGIGMPVRGSAAISRWLLAQLAQHECGHAAVSIALGYPIERITLTGPRGPATYPTNGARKLYGQQILIQASGFIADYQRRGLRMRGSQIAKLLIGGDDDHFEVDDPSDQLAVRPSRALGVAPGADLHDLGGPDCQGAAFADADRGLVARVRGVYRRMPASDRRPRG